ncbi:hypothetical protein KBC03_05665 [Patescibacteria group bacterium]|nr:hypothetical protein [Patescibacteria group bacterium]
MTADIIGGNSTTSASSADISYTIADNALSIDSEKVFEGAKSLTFMLIYDPDSTNPDTSAIYTSHDYTSSSGKEGVTHVTIFFS